MNANPQPSAYLVTIALSAPASTETGLRRLPSGQAHWWIQCRTRVPGVIPFVSLPRIPGNQALDVSVDLIPGARYRVGCGTRTRYDFTCPPASCAIAADKGTSGRETPGTARMAGPLAALPTDPTPEHGFHVRNAPIGSVARGVTYDTATAAFSALGQLVASGAVTTDDVGAGTYAVVPLPWPRASYPPPAPPIVLDIMRAALVGTDDYPADDDSDEVAGFVPGTFTDDTFTPEPVDDTPAASFTYSAPSQGWTNPANVDTVARVNADTLHLQATGGIVRPPTAVILGGVINDVGRENLQRSHGEWSRNPTTIDACAELARTVRAENRMDLTCHDTPRMDDTGLLYIGGGVGSVAIEDSALGDLVGLHSRTLPRAAGVMAVLEPSTRARVWNEQTSRSDARENATVLRTRATAGGRAVFAAVSDGYTPFDADRIATITARALSRVQGGSSARGEATYTPSDTSVAIDATWHANHVRDFGAGDVISGGVRVRAKDNGSGAIAVYPTAHFNLCFNLIITARVDGDVIRIVHRGSDRSIEDRLVDAIHRSAAVFAPFIARWQHFRTVDVDTLIENPSASAPLNLAAVFRSIAGAAIDADLPTVKRGVIPAGVSWSGITRDSLVESLLTGHAHQGGSSLVSVLNAVTRLHADTRVPVPVVMQAEHNAGLLQAAWHA